MIHAFVLHTTYRQDQYAYPSSAFFQPYKKARDIRQSRGIVNALEMTMLLGEQLSDFRASLL
jgi:hypothetical protein